MAPLLSLSMFSTTPSRRRRCRPLAFLCLSILVPCVARNTSQRVLKGSPSTRSSNTMTSRERFLDFREVAFTTVQEEGPPPPPILTKPEANLVEDKNAEADYSDAVNPWQRTYLFTNRHAGGKDGNAADFGLGGWQFYCKDKGKGKGSKTNKSKTPAPTINTPWPSSSPSSSPAPTKNSKKKSKKKCIERIPSPSPVADSVASPSTETESSSTPAGSPSVGVSDGAGSELTTGNPTLDTTDAGEDVCSAIQEGQKPKSGLGEPQEFSVTICIAYNSTEATQQNITDGMMNDVNPPIELWVAGCQDLAMTYLTERGLLPRWLASNTVVFADLGEWGSNSGQCSASEGGTGEIFKNSFEIYVDGSISSDVLKQRIQEAFEIFLALVKPGITGVLDVGDIEVEKKGNTANSITEDKNAVVRGSTTGAIVGSVAAALAFFLLIVLLARRNRGSDEVSHSKLEDDGELFREIETTASSPSRKAHVVGETDSVNSGWTGYTPKAEDDDDDDGFGVTGRLGHHVGDVHMCSSATCEVCERRRQQGIQFIPTGTPPRPSPVPADASREYIAEDTVEL